MNREKNISCLSISDEKTQINWSFEGRNISVKCDFAHQASLDDKRNLVVVLQGKGDNPTKMLAYDLNGVELSEFNQPNGFYFSYLVNNPDLGLAVVCSTDNPIDDWYDWYFLIDFKRKLLIRKGPSY